jgi:hypothetical protein
LLTGCFSGFTEVRRGGCIGFSDGLSRTRFRIDEHLLASFLRFPDDSAFVNKPRPFSLGIFEGPFRDVVRVVGDLFARFEDLLRLADIGGYGEPHLIYEVEYPLAVDDEVAANGQSSRLDYELFKAIDEVQNFQ